MRPSQLNWRTELLFTAPSQVSISLSITFIRLVLSTWGFVKPLYLSGLLSTSGFKKFVSYFIPVDSLGSWSMDEDAQYYGQFTHFVMVYFGSFCSVVQKIDLWYGIIDNSEVRVAMSILLQIVLPHWNLLFLLVQKDFGRFVEWKISGVESVDKK